MAQSVVLGIGNVLLKDEGVGVHAVRRLDSLLAHRSDVQVIDGGTLSFTLAPLLAEARRLIVIDAAQLHELPGTVRTFFGAELDDFLGTAKLSVHEVSLVDLLDIARLTDALPVERALIAVQPGAIEWGEHLTPKVADSLESVVSQVIDLLDAWPLQAPQALKIHAEV